MDELVLSAAEAVCLSAGLGAAELVGFPDLLASLSREAAQKTAEQVCEVLEQKGLITETAEGRSVAPDCADLLETAARCQWYVSALAVKGTEELAVLRFYGRDGQIVSVKENGERFTFRRSGPEELHRTLFGAVAWGGLTGTLPQTRAEIERKTFDRLATMSADAAVKALTGAGLDPQTAALTADGLFHRAGFYAFVFLSRKGAGDSVRSVLFVADERGVVTISPLERDGRSYVAVGASGPDGVQQALERDMQWILTDKGGE